MPDPKKPMGQSSLLSFFTKKTEPAPQSKPAPSPQNDLMQVDSTIAEEPNNAQKRRRAQVTYNEFDSEEEEPVKPSATGKKRKLVRRISNEDSEDEYTPTNNNKEDDDVFDDISDTELMEIERDIATSKNRIPVTPIAEKFQKFSVSSTPAPPTFNTGATAKQTKAQKFKEKNETRYQWLQNLRDADGNPVDSPNYDPRTLYIPASAWRDFTPFEKQYWEVKCKHWDTVNDRAYAFVYILTLLKVVFFKKGKFYELYEKDADIGHKDFDLKMTDRVNMRMVGVPEMSFDYWAAQFIAKGHKVAKVDQMETAIGKSMREKNTTTKQDKVIRRELTSVLTAGTLVDAGLLTNDLSTYCMSIKEQCMNEQSEPRFGICFVDTATAEFNLVHFEDDMNRTKLETLLMQIKPRELVTEKGRLTKSTMQLIKSTVNDPLWNMLIPEREFWDDRTTEDEIRINEYFGSEMTEKDNLSGFDHAMQELHTDPLLMSAFGAMIWYLRSLKLDKDLLSAKHIQMYDPIRLGTSLVLDGQTLANLEIFQNSHDGSTDGTVFKLLANSITPFGKRLFKRWLCHPLRRIQDINARLDAIEDLMQLNDAEIIAKQLASLPDLERLISRIHSGSVKVKEFLTVLEGFRTTEVIIETMKQSQSQLKSSLLNRLMDDFPQIGPALEELSGLFTTADVDMDYQKVKAMIPKSGKNADWDKLNNDIDAIGTEFQTHLASLKKQLKCSSLAYKDLGKDIYQIEVPKGVSVPSDWIKLSNTAKFNRYWDSTVKRLVTKYKELLETKNEFVKKFSQQVYAHFDEFYPMWLSAVSTVAQLDALMGLAKGSMNMGEPICRPTLLDQEKSVIEFEELRHPCVVPGVSTDFIPNDVALGGERSNMIVLTGPNMGGKSTLLRQTCVAIILAQLGSYVPARSCQLTPCDRIYTRIGANDNIMGGQSTFMVELAETSKILREATPRSMVILDELGRGTSTYDGYAIAYSVLHYLSTHIGCLGMFATHYQTLCREFERNPEINNMHM
ncbi:Putative DNA mismatch repair protein msh6 [Rhizopus microsporus]|nr:Putative DNA mismatch repair protein msh6 [Rhizopus microsporus]